MRQLSAAGQQLISDISQRHGFGSDAVMSMLDAVIQGNGSMAQFSHPEFSGSGQWMRGGMTMVSDMFNGHLKGRVDALCNELSNVLANQPDLVRSGSFQSQSQGAGASLFVPAPPDWWGPELRWPNSTGSQNGVRYAHFAQARRLAIELNGHVTIYDTLDHQIGGFSQQQSVGGSLGFNSQYGLIDVGSLPVVSVDGHAPLQQGASMSFAQPPQQAMQAMQASPPVQGASTGGDVFATIERLAELRAKGVLSDEEFSAKKAELLARL